MTGISLAWALTTNAVAHALDSMPMPRGMNEAEVGRWRLVVNNSDLELKHSRADKPSIELPPYEVYVEHLDFFLFGLLGPAGGLIGGGAAAEEQLISDMVAYLPAAALEPFREELAYRKDMKQ